MKIEHPDKSQSLNGPIVNKARPKGMDGTTDFAAVLKEASETVPSGNRPVTTLSPPIHSSMAGLVMQSQTAPEESAARLIDILESYQRALADPGANLRQVRPVVDQMKATANQIQPQVEALPEGHLVKGVIEDTLMHINMEITRFDRGDYVDE